MVAAFPKCRTAVINRLFAVADSDNVNHIDSLARACRHLRRLHIECGILEQMLVKLAINQSPALGTRLFPFLNHLYLGQFHITDGTTLACVMSFPSLVFLSLSRCDMDETDQFLDQFNQAMPAGGSAVKSFIMRRRSGFYPASFLIAIAQLCPRLQKYITTYGSPVFLPALQSALPNVDVALF
ncbi:hypothetical protein GQ42DRAFT_160164 [Ramicandelaber brevisporus]|nr:hypothetical protein GQ42DRAFT_160164 [Ramicandelaber brevisporus]